MKTIKACEIEIGMDLVERGGALLTVKQIRKQGRFILLVCETLMQEVVAKVREDKMVNVENEGCDCFPIWTDVGLAHHRNCCN